MRQRLTLIITLIVVVLLLIGLNAASYVEIDGVIDPADTRRWILAGLASVPPPDRGERRSRKRPCIDPW